MIHTILVTDDNIIDNAVLRNFLCNQKLNIVSAINGREALDLLESRNIDVILLDLVMPVLDGFGFLKELSKTKYCTEIPVIVISSIYDDETVNKVMNYNIFDYLIKPIDEKNRLIFTNKIKKAIEYRILLQQLERAKADLKKT